MGGERRGDLHDRAVSADHEDRVVGVRVTRREFRRVPGTLGEHEVAVDRAVGQRALRVAGEPSSSARRRIRDDDRALDQKRKVWCSEKLRFCGWGTTPMMLCPPSRSARSSTDRSRSASKLRLEPVLDLCADSRQQVRLRELGVELAEPRVQAEEHLVGDLLLDTDRRAIDVLPDVARRLTRLLLRPAAQLESEGVDPRPDELAEVVGREGAERGSDELGEDFALLRVELEARLAGHEVAHEVRLRNGVVRVAGKGDLG